MELKKLPENINELKKKLREDSEFAREMSMLGLAMSWRKEAILLSLATILFLAFPYLPPVIDKIIAWQWIEDDLVSDSWTFYTVYPVLACGIAIFTINVIITSRIKPTDDLADALTLALPLVLVTALGAALIGALGWASLGAIVLAVSWALIGTLAKHLPIALGWASSATLAAALGGALATGTITHPDVMMTIIVGILLFATGTLSVSIRWNRYMRFWCAAHEKMLLGFTENGNDTLEPILSAGGNVIMINDGKLFINGRDSGLREVKWASLSPDGYFVAAVLGDLGCVVLKSGKEPVGFIPVVGPIGWKGSHVSVGNLMFDLVKSSLQASGMSI